MFFNWFTISRSLIDLFWYIFYLFFIFIFIFYKMHTKTKRRTSKRSFETPLLNILFTTQCAL